MRQVRKGVVFTGLLAIAALAGCADSGSQDEAFAETDMAGAAVEMTADESAEARSDADPQLDELPVALPKMAYVFDFGFSMPGDDIESLQERHADLCEAQGPYNCQILELSHSGEAEEYARGTLRLAVAADKARDFGKRLTSTTEDAGREQVRSSLQGEDLSKAIVDTEARLRARTVLRDRLLETLRTLRGTVSELVEAERGVAQVNEEIDQARSWLAELKGRVAFSRVNIAYEAEGADASSFLSPIKSAVDSIGGILGMVFAALIVLLTLAIPVGLVVFAAARLRRWFAARDAKQLAT